MKKTALLIIDVINTLDFAEGKKLLKHALPVAQNIKTLKNRLRKKGVPVIYVNDNFGDWHSDWKKVFAKCSDEKAIGCELASLLKPNEDDFFVLKPKHSGFFGTTLELLLRNLGIETVILTGLAGNICVLFTAHDAHMRGFKIIVPRDCIASNSKKENDAALELMNKSIGIQTPRSPSI